MKKLISGLAAVVMAMAVCVQTASAAMIGDTSSSKVDYLSVMNVLFANIWRKLPMMI